MEGREAGGGWCPCACERQGAATALSCKDLVGACHQGQLGVDIRRAKHLATVPNEFQSPSTIELFASPYVAGGGLGGVGERQSNS